MKKIVVLVVMMTLMLQGAAAQTVESLINTFSTEKGVEKTHVGKAMMRLGAVSSKTRKPTCHILPRALIPYWFWTLTTARKT